MGVGEGSDSVSLVVVVELPRDSGATGRSPLRVIPRVGNPLHLSALDSLAEETWTWIQLRSISSVEKDFTLEQRPRES